MYFCNNFKLFYSPNHDLTNTRTFNQREWNPLSGMLYEIVINNIVDLVHLRHAKAAKTKNAPDSTFLINYFSGTITKDDTKFFETLQNLPKLSNSFCGTIVTPRFQNWWLQTKPSKGNLKLNHIQGVAIGI